MAAATTNPWNDNPASEPTAETLGADANGAFVLADELGDLAPIKDGSMLHADMVKRAFEALLAASLMGPSLRVTVRFNAGVPVVDSFRARRTTLRTEDITFVDGGTGITTVRVVDTYLPPKRGEPAAFVHEGTDPGIKPEHYAATGFRGATVTTLAGGVAADLKFSVEIW